MILILSDFATNTQLMALQEEFEGYIKIVVDVEKEILAAGGKFHIDCEEVLTKNGSSRKNLFGGGYDVKTRAVDFFAMSNYKPAEGYVTYEIADPKTRETFEKIVMKFFK